MQRLFQTLPLLLLNLSLFAFATTDTIISPPEEVNIYGDDSVCIYQTEVYTSDLPINCSASWFIDEVLQTDDTLSEIEINWTEDGNHELKLMANCDSASSAIDSIIVNVKAFPAMPGLINGNTISCLESVENYSVEIDSGEYCNWFINDILQQDTINEISVLWDSVGLQQISVMAFNNCGSGAQRDTTISILDQPLVNLGVDTTIYEGQSILLDAQNPGSDFLWNTGDTTQTILVNQSGDYWVEVDNFCGFDSDTIIVDVILGIDNKSSSQFVSYSNLTNILKLNNIEGMSSLCEIYDLSGKLILTSQQREFYFNKKGLFIIKLKTGQKIYSTKLLIY